MSLDARPTSVTSTPQPVLELEGVSVAFPHRRSMLTVVREATLSVAPGKVVGLVGESGSGKSVTAMSSLGLIGRLGGRVTGGTIRLDGRDVTNLGEREWASLRGAVAGMIFQQPTRTLNPAYTVGDQIAEVVRRHRGVGRKESWDRAVEMLEKMQIVNPDRRAHDYPHQLSGGMCQRVAIAMALVCEPQLLIADEPTTALDVTVQRRILELLLDLRESMDLSILFITHDLGVVAEMCDDVAVMYAGEVVERAAISELYDRPRHPYTAGLLASLPDSVGTSQIFNTIPGQVPPPHDMPTGCRFAPRCPHAVEGLCTSAPPDLRLVGPRAFSRCVRAEELDLGRAEA